MKAAPRDASWYNHPNVTSFKVVHADNGDEFARCNSQMILGGPVWADAAEVPKNVRCGRAACAAAFAEADRANRTIRHEEDVDDYTMCVCGSPMDACPGINSEGTNRTVGSRDGVSG